jgi:hypothetical protein
MSLAATPPTPRRRSRRWYVAVFSLAAVVIVTGVAGGVHWYSLYAHGLNSSVAPAVLHYPQEKEPAKAKSDKASSGEKTGGSAKGASDTQADGAEKVSSHKPAAKPTPTPTA